MVPAATALLLARDDKHGEWRSVSEARSGATIDVYKAGKGWRNAVADQQAFIRREDAQTRRIAYLYDDTKMDVAAGHFIQQAFVPTPRPTSNTATGDSDDDSLYTSDSERDDVPFVSSPDDSDIGVSALGPARRKIRRARVHDDRQHDSSSDSEADTPSACSAASTASDPSDVPGASDVLAAKIKQLRTMGRPLVDFEAVESNPSRNSTEGVMTKTRASGTVIKVSVRPVTVAVKPSVVPTAPSLVHAFTEIVSSAYVLSLTSGMPTHSVARQDLGSAYQTSVSR